MAIVLARIKVADYDKWRQMFDSAAELRKSHGCNGAHIFYNARDKTDVVINFQWDSEENYQRFVAGAEARAAMQEAGLVGVPEVVILEDGGRTPS